ncbi:MAG: HEAT repeat domain-containing protein [Myxococcota bacterium]|nr:HEAT repeat domain-containing protein [Myxococcota bacterium]
MLDELHLLRDKARAAAAQGDEDAAIMALVAAAGQTHVSEHEYAIVLRPLAEALARRGDARGSLTVIEYLACEDPQAWTEAKALWQEVPPVDRARALAAQGRMADAAREMENGGLVAAAAICREKAKEWSAAGALWSRLAHVMDGRKDPYVAALIRFNLARCARQCGDESRAREAIVATVRLLEETADHFESVGRRERAFDCFHVLAQVGRESGSFEDVLEGLVNCIRVLREDHLKQFALEYFEEAIAASTERGETSAAATLAREAASYARSLGWLGTACGYSVRQAELWRSVAKQNVQRGAPAEVAENALLAANVAFGEVGQFARVGRVYGELAQLDLEAAQREHYGRAARRYENADDEHIEASRGPPRPLRNDAQPTEVWHVDVIEWEQRGSAAEACADVLVDKRIHQLIRRKALLARLTALEVEANENDSGPSATSARVRLAEQLAQLQLYAVLSPLERLFERPERRVKMAVLRAMQTLFFKRTFVTVRAGLRAVEPSVVEQATKAVEALYFQHAVDPLARIVAECSEAPARAAALRALARIDTVEAAELLMGVLEHGAPVDRNAALAALRETRGAKFVELARASFDRASAPLHAALRDVLTARGLP